MKTNALITSIVLALAPFTTASTELHQPIYANRVQGASEPKVSAVFQAGVSQLALEGLKLKEAVEASLDGGSRHLAAIFQQEKPKAPNEAFELRIIESDGHASKTIFRRAD